MARPEEQRALHVREADPLLPSQPADANPRANTIASSVTWAARWFTREASQ